jgi:GWxTD domain-containing protein
MIERVLLEAAVRALLLALATGAVVWVMRVKTAAGQHAAWRVVLLGMLALPLWMMWGPQASLPVASSRPLTVWALPASPAPGPVSRVETTTETASLGNNAAATRTGSALRRASWRPALVLVYGTGVLVLLGRLVVGTVQAHRLIRRAVREGDHWTSDLCASPVTIGWLRPVVILPPRWDTWSDGQLAAVMAHEQEHARRRDPLVHWLALLNRAVFWFHPLAWWLELRLASLAEAACDAAVVARGHERADYCEYLLSLARTVAATGKRIDIVGMAMPGPSLSQRVDRILNHVPEPSLSSRRVACAVSACALLSAIAASTTLTSAAATPSSVARASTSHAVVQGGERLPEYWFDEDEWHREVAPLMTADEMASYAQVRTSTARDAFMAQFWKRRDPTPDTEVNEAQIEFTRRVDYAREHLANPDSAAVPGYETDRGRWYVLFGSPETLRTDAAGSEEWRYRSVAEFGSNVVIRFDPTSAFACTYRGGRYRIVSPEPRRRFESPGTNAFALTYPDRFVYLSFPIDPKAVSIRWGMRAQSGAQTTFGESRGPIDYVQGAIGAVVTGAQPGASPPILEHVRDLRLFEAGGIACTEQLPADTYTLLIETTLRSGETRHDELTFVVE